MTGLRPPCDEGILLSAPPCPPSAPRGVPHAAAAEPEAGGAWVLAATILGSSMAFIDGTAVNVARVIGPAIAGLVSLVGLQLAGRFTDRFGSFLVGTAGSLLVKLAVAQAGHASTGRNSHA